MSVPTLPDVKAQLNITDSSSDEELYTYLQAALQVVEARIGLSSVQTVIEVIESHGPEMIFSNRPIVSITSLEPMLNTWPSFTGDDLAFAPDSGAVWRKDYQPLAGKFTCTYRAGWAVFPDRYNLATRLLVQHLYRSQRGGSARPTMGLTAEFASEVARQAMPTPWELPPIVEVLLKGPTVSFGIA